MTKATTHEPNREDLVGTIMSTVWLVVLIPRIVDFINGDYALGERITGVGLTIAFIAVYLMVLTFAFSETPRATHTRIIVVGIASMVAIIVVLYVMVGPLVLSYGYFLIPALNFTVPLRWAPYVGSIPALIVGAMGYELGGLGVALGAGGGALGVHLMTFGSRYFEESAKWQTEVATRSAIVDERERVARDVHDVLGHSLTLIALKSELAAKMLERDPDKAALEIREINQLSRAAIAEVRSTVSGLRAHKLADELPLCVDALEQAGIEVEVRGSAADVDPRHYLLFAWVLREAVTNVMRHAQASRLTVALGSSEIAVTDNGRGLADSDVAGNGLRGLRERVEQAGGRAEFTTGPRGGTLVSVSMEA